MSEPEPPKMRRCESGHWETEQRGVLLDSPLAVSSPPKYLSRLFAQLRLDGRQQDVSKSLIQSRGTRKI